MLEVHNNVASRLKAKVPHFIHTHCAAHQSMLTVTGDISLGIREVPM